VESVLHFDIILNTVTVGVFGGMLMHCLRDRQKKFFAKGTFTLMLVFGILHVLSNTAQCLFEINGMALWLKYLAAVQYSVSGMFVFAAFNNFLFEILKPTSQAYKNYRRIYQFILIAYTLLATVLIPLGKIFIFKDSGMEYNGPMFLILHLYSLVGLIVDYMLVLSVAMPHKTRIVLATFCLMPLVAESLLLMFMAPISFSDVSLLCTTPILFTKIFITDKNDFFNTAEAKNVTNIQ